MVRCAGPKAASTSRPRASASTKSGPVPRPATWVPSYASATQHALLAAGALPLVDVVGVLVGVVEDRGLGFGHLGEHALLPDLLAAGALQVLDRRLDLLPHRREVDAD